MNYELAKQLKDAGFPWKGPFFENEEYYREYYPTLSELIEACGDKFDALVSSERSGGWMATDGRGLSGDGSTPEEAVANLWLELNK